MTFFILLSVCHFGLALLLANKPQTEATGISSLVSGADLGHSPI